MRQRQVSEYIDAEVDDEMVIINDGMNGSVTLNANEFMGLITMFVREGGLEDTQDEPNAIDDSVKERL